MKSKEKYNIRISCVKPKLQFLSVESLMSWVIMVKRMQNFQDYESQDIIFFTTTSVVTQLVIGE